MSIEGGGHSGWTMTSDASIGGNSKHVLFFQNNSVAPTTETRNTPPHFLLWSGTIKPSTGETDSEEVAKQDFNIMKNKMLKTRRSGFVSIRSPNLNPGSTDLIGDGAFLEIDEYEALELKLRFNHTEDVADGLEGSPKKWSSRTSYMLNLYVDSYIPGDMYQGYIIPPTEKSVETGEPELVKGWITYSLPFGKFLLTGEGRVRETQRPLDGVIRLRHVGVTAIRQDKEDARGGDFRVDFGSIRAIGMMGGRDGR